MVTHLLQETQLRGQLQKALKTWRTLSDKEGDLLAGLRLVQQKRDGKLREVLMPATALRLATNEILLEGVDALETQEELYARILRERFLNGHTLEEVSHMVNRSVDGVSRKQREGIDALTQVIWELEEKARSERIRELLGKLPEPSYAKLFGVDDKLARLVEQLVEEKEATLTAVEGLGGLGKTALVDAAVRQVIPTLQFEQVYWVMVPRSVTLGRSESPGHKFSTLLSELGQQMWPGQPLSLVPEELLALVQQRLQETACLVVVDNLETEADVAYLLSRLPSLGAASRLVLTTRIYATTAQTAVYRISLSELSRHDAESLMRHYAQAQGSHLLEDAPCEDFDDIYRITGGNPLALKLVADLLNTYPLAYLLGGFTDHQLPAITNQIYDRIYRLAWETLSEDAKTLLQAMPLIAESGAEPELLHQMTGLSRDALWAAIQELATRSLIEVRGSIRQRRYGIHQLTDSYIRRRIIGWDDEAS